MQIKTGNAKVAWSYFEIAWWSFRRFCMFRQQQKKTWNLWHICQHETVSGKLPSCYQAGLFTLHNTTAWPRSLSRLSYFHFHPICKSPLCCAKGMDSTSFGPESEGGGFTLKSTWDGEQVAPVADRCHTAVSVASSTKSHCQLFTAPEVLSWKVAYRKQLPFLPALSVVQLFCGIILFWFPPEPHWYSMDQKQGKTAEVPKHHWRHSWGAHYCPPGCSFFLKHPSIHPTINQQYLI